MAQDDVEEIDRERQAWRSGVRYLLCLQLVGERGPLVAPVP